MPSLVSAVIPRDLQGSEGCFAGGGAHVCHPLLNVDCRAGCGACCIAPSISSAIPGMPGGKPAGVRCIHLTVDRLCAIYGHPDRPAVCGSLRASVEMCGSTDAEALDYLAGLEAGTAPSAHDAA